ncbi:hemerythrin domain-containing protein [Bacillus sp. V3B]|uniref:hemerythrin domain-containing protein n=1 Tax=Bacillus sp. V3B TaxID=2804915 RepID=UPI00210CE22B|nr:hemerythrin domain-containing protein [Bacillus sp. V3B]MCQ6277348.1 hemerythrin domain-containing protein [Bacillus sp. V3B]
MQGCPSGLIGNEPVELSEGLLKLVNEHPPLRELLENLSSLCKKVEMEEEKEASFKQLIEEVIDFSTKLEYHSGREEDYLFRMMEVYIGKESGPIAVMEYEHEQAKGFISKFMQNTKSPSQLTPDEMVNNSTLIKNAYYTLLDHFAKEEQVLYPMAERMLSQEEKETLTQKIS